MGLIANSVAIDTLVPESIRHAFGRRAYLFSGLAMILFGSATALALATWSISDPSLNHAVTGDINNALGRPGAIIADLLMQLFGLISIFLVAFLIFWGVRLLRKQHMPAPARRGILSFLALAAGATAIAALPTPGSWPLPTALGGFLGDFLYQAIGSITGGQMGFFTNLLVFLAASICFALLALRSLDLSLNSFSAPEDSALPEIDEQEFDDDYENYFDEDESDGTAWLGAASHITLSLRARARRLFRRTPQAIPTIHEEQTRAQEGLFLKLVRWGFARFRGTEQSDYDYQSADFARFPESGDRVEPVFNESAPAYSGSSIQMTEQHNASDYAHDDMFNADNYDDYEDFQDEMIDEEIYPERVYETPRVEAPTARPKQGKRITREAQPSLLPSREFVLPPLRLLSKPAKISSQKATSLESLEQNARMLESVLEDYGIKGEIIKVRPGPVVTLYELEPAPGIKSARVIGLADDIARSMSAISARIAVIPGRNAIGIELPNSERETVFLREVLASETFEKSKAKLPLVLGKTIGGEPVIADLARMPHLLIAGTTGSGKSVGINAMILSLLYRLPPDKCKMIMIDPKMLELSVYDGIPHLLSPVVTDPKKAVVALKWTVREMEERYKKMSKLGVRNIDGFNQRVVDARDKGEVISRTVQTGFDRETGKAVYETEEMSLDEMPFIVVIVDEMADLMMVAGKDIEGTIQRLAQMARAAGIHIITATQRPSVDVITGTIKANFPTRISFQVTSKIDSRTILGEQGAEQLLGQGDMLHMAGGGRISRVHGAFVSDDEVERIVNHLKKQGVPEYLDVVTEDTEESEIDASTGMPVNSDTDDLYNRAVNIVLHDRKASTSYIQRRLSIGYNRAATIIEQMEAEGVISAANHAGKRDILVGEDA